jgi:hypothetical protein
MSHRLNSVLFLRPYLSHIMCCKKNIADQRKFKFAGIRHHNLSHFAECFQAEDWSTLIYDNRNFGDSEGLPKSEIDPTYQVRDYFDAFDFAVSQPEVDDTRVAYWGTSLGRECHLCSGRRPPYQSHYCSESGCFWGNHATPLAPMLPEIFVNRASVREGKPSIMVPVMPATAEEAESGKSPADLNTLEAF